MLIFTEPLSRKSMVCTLVKMLTFMDGPKEDLSPLHAFLYAYYYKPVQQIITLADNIELIQI